MEWTPRRIQGTVPCVGAASALRRPNVNTKYLQLFCVGCAIALGVWLRAESLARKSAWEDECWTVERTCKPTLVDVVRDLRGSAHPPLYYVAVWCYLQLCASPSIADIRIVSMLCGIAALPLTYLMWRRLISRKAVIWLTILVSLNSYHIWYSRDAKMYAAVWLLSMMSCATYVWCILGAPRRRDYVLLAVCNGCLIMVSYVGSVAIGVECVHALCILFFIRKRRRPVIACGVATAIGMLPFLMWVPVAWDAVTQRPGIKWIPPITAANIPADLFRLSALVLTGIWPGSFECQNGWGILFFTLVPLSVACGLIAISLHLVEAFRGPPSQVDTEGVCEPRNMYPNQREITVFLLLWICLPVLLAILYSFAVYPLWGIPRYLMSVAPAPLVLLATAAAELRPRVMWNSVAILIVSTNLLAQVFDHQSATRVPWNEVVKAVDQGAGNNNIRRQASLPDSGKVQTAYFGVGTHYFDHKSFKYAIKQHDGTADRVIRPLFNLDQTHLSGTLIVVTQCPGVMDDRSQLALRAILSSHECLRIYGTRTCEDHWCRLPTPFVQQSTEVWVCHPKAKR
ncbi:MAG: glycosyl transferase family 39 [Schlesneria sp.]|nr:glycosyl transferase family 39 [Schlesneria sp.]